MQSPSRSYTHLSVMQISLGVGYVFASGHNVLFSTDICYGTSWLDLSLWRYNIVENFSISEAK